MAVERGLAALQAVWFPDAMTHWRFGFSLLLVTALVPCAFARTQQSAKTNTMVPAMPAGMSTAFPTSVPMSIKPDMALKPLSILPQDDVLPATLDAIYANREDIDQALVVVEMGQGEDNPRWMMSATQLQVLQDTLLQFMPDKKQPEDAIWPKLKVSEPKYRGLRVVLSTVYGKRFEPFTVFEGKIMAADGTVMVPDYGRRFEYWMFGTSRVRRDQLLGAHVLPVITFEQCRLLGQQIVETRPRQCLLPDNNLLLETEELPTLTAARIKDFDGCLKNGKALIYTFPRRCLASGGRVFTEPPKVYEIPVETPADAPLLGASAFSAPVASGTQATGAVDPLTGNPAGSLLLNTQLGGPLDGAGGGTPLPGTPVPPQ